MPANYILGKDGKLYINDPDGPTGAAAHLFDASANATPTLLNTANAFTLYTNVQDVTLNTDTETVDVTNRSTAGFRAEVATLKTATIETQVLWLPENTAFTFIREAWENSLEIAVMAMDGAWDTAGNSGLIGNFTVSGFSREEPIADVMRVNITLTGSSFLQWYTHSA